MNTMLVTYDSDADALYVYLQRSTPVARSVLVDEGRVVDLDESGGVVGIEILEPSNGVDLTDIIERFGLHSMKAELIDAVREFPSSAAV